MRIPLPITVLAVIALAAACGGAGTPTNTTAATTAPPGATGTPAGATATTGGNDGGSDPNNISCNDGVVGSQVSIVDFGYNPTTIAADADDTVNWTNSGAASHTVTFDNGKDCGSLGSGDTLTVLFLAPGTYAYHCDFHATMTGTVTVN